jgi:DNA-binding response OmpR family regulator
MADLRRGMELGADDYLTKPCTVEQFLSTINTRLKRHEEMYHSGTRALHQGLLRLLPWMMEQQLRRRKRIFSRIVQN